jgi:hypothetical protein
MGAVFTRPELVLEPGLQQLFAFALVLIGTLGLVCSVHAVYSETPALDIAFRTALAVCSIAALAPGDMIAWTAALPVALMVGYGFYRSGRIALASAEYRHDGTA